MLAIMAECGCQNLDTTSSYETTLASEVNKGTSTADFLYTVAIPSVLDGKCAANLIATCDLTL